MSWLFKSSSSPSSPERQQEAPPPPSSASPSSKGLVGVENDLAEFGESLKSCLSKFTSSFLACHSNPNPNEHEEEEEEDDYVSYEEGEEEEDYVAGLTVEVIGFVEEISTCPECWTEFPLPLRNDFRMSDSQREHASTVEQMVPSLAALRASLHNYIGDEQFWMVYFIFLHPILSKQDLEILSTTQIVETRNLALQKIKNKRIEEVKKSESASTSVPSEDSSKAHETREVKVPCQEKEVTEIVNATKELEINREEITEHWLEETDVNTSSSMDNCKKLENEEDLPFSDLDDDENDLSSSDLEDDEKEPSSRVFWDQLNEEIVRQLLEDDENDLSSRVVWDQLHEEIARQSFSRDKDSDDEFADWIKVDEFD